MQKVKAMLVCENIISWFSNVSSSQQCPVEVRGVAMPRIQDLSRATGLLVALRQGGLTQAPEGPIGPAGN